MLPSLRATLIVLAFGALVGWLAERPEPLALAAACVIAVCWINAFVSAANIVLRMLAYPFEPLWETQP